MIEKLSGFASRTETDSFKILIVGEFKNGKSTFINALLGERVLPQDVLPCTAVISEVVYGEEKGAVIHFENPLPEVISKHLHEKINAQIAQHKDDPEGVPPIEMTFEELGHVVTIPEKELLGEDSANEPEDFSPNPEDETEAGKEAIGKIPLSHAEIRFPLEILKDGVEIIDTPGLNEDKSREEVRRLNEELEKRGDELAKSSEERAKHEEAVRKLNDKTSRLDEQCSSLEEEISSMVEENRKRDEENRLRFSEAREIIYETGELKQKITDRINRSRDELYSLIRDSILSCYESILSEVPSFVRNKKYYNEIGIWDSIFEGDDAKKKLAAEIIESLKEFFDDGIKDGQTAA